MNRQPAIRVAASMRVALRLSANRMRHTAVASLSLLLGVVAGAHGGTALDFADGVEGDVATALIFSDGVEGGDVAVWSNAVGYVAPLHRVGRFDLAQPSPLRFTWPGSEIRARFSGTALTLQLEETAPNHYDVVIDGALLQVLVTVTGVQNYSFSGLAAGPHDVVVTRRTESLFGVSRFLGFPGAALTPTAAPTRRIEMIGDAITCGYGVLGPDPYCSFSAATEAETHAWGAFAAAALGATHTSIAYSLKGLYRNYGGDTTDPMPVLWARTLADNPASPWHFGSVPAAVVIALGTHDYATGDPGQPFVNAMIAFVGQIRARYPGAEIVVTSSPVLDGAQHTSEVAYLQQAVAASGPHVSFLDLPPQDPANGWGCDYYPSETTQQLMAAALVTHLQTLLGW